MSGQITNITTKCNSFWAAQLGCLMYRTTVFFNIPGEPFKRTASMCSQNGYYTDLEMMRSLERAVSQMKQIPIG